MYLSIKVTTIITEIYKQKTKALQAILKIVEMSFRFNHESKMGFIFFYINHLEILMFQMIMKDQL